METSHHHHMPVFSAGLAFGAAASLFSNLGVSIAIFIIDSIYSFVLPKYYMTSQPPTWLTDVLPIVAIIIFGVFFIWLGVTFTGWLFKKRHVSTSSAKLPMVAISLFVLPIVFWFIVQCVGDWIVSHKLNWIALGYLVAQALIFGGSVYIFVERYRRKLGHHERLMAPLIEISHRWNCYIAGVLAFICSIAGISFLHALEVVSGGSGRPIVLRDGMNLYSDMATLLTLAGVMLVTGAGMYALRTNKSPAKALRLFCKFSTYEYIFAVVSAASGVITALAFATQIDFVFTPYTTLLTTTIVLLGVVFSAIRYAEGKRDRLFVTSRTVAYVVGFFGQPSVLGTLIALSQRMLG